MYKMCYYRFGQVYTEGGNQSMILVGQLHNYLAGKPPGYDRVRNAEIGNKDFELDVLEEAYTSEHWIVRIYKVDIDINWQMLVRSYFSSQVKDLPNRGTRQSEQIAEMNCVLRHQHLIFRMPFLLHRVYHFLLMIVNFNSNIL